MAYQIAGEGTVGYQAISEISTTKKHELGTEVLIVDKTNSWAGKAMYVAFPISTAVPAGSLVTFVTPTASATVSPFRVTVVVQATHKNKGVPVFVTLTAVTSSTSVQYGWVLVDGIGPTLKENQIVPISTSSVMISGTQSGRVKIITSAGCQLLGARFVQSSVTTTTSLVNIYYNRAATQTQIT